VGYFEEEKFKQGWIYTGDIFALSSFNSDVILKYQGRAGDRIKINGHHAYLNEIDCEILKIEGVEDCYSRVAETEGFKKKLLIRIVTEASIDSIASCMKKIEVLNRMPFMLEKVSRIPRTISGKVQRYI
jgi:acyl-coenzyme A synthetase/AMP-(fatty) acid ligase